MFDNTVDAPQSGIGAAPEADIDFSKAFGGI